ncbi:MAG: ATP-binding protein [Eubacteriales bacterium]|nr:ATP-binding protein [Eubacteriales bacterium]
MTRQEHIDRLLGVYARRRAAAEQERDERIARVRSEHPEIASLIDEGRELASESARRLALQPARGRELAAEMRRRSLDWDSRLKQAVRSAGLEEDVLSLRPKCPYCKDLGYVAESFPRRYCACFESALVREMSEAMATEQSFEIFSLDVFPQDVPGGQGFTQREFAERVRRLLLYYTEHYPANAKPNVTLLGKSGLGKTFFLNCVAQRLRERGFPVLQMTGFRMLEAMRRRHMGSFEGRDAFDEMLEAPFLILDDLGSEPMLNNITIEYLFTLLNERSAAGRPTFAATNFSMSELQEHYNERIASRLLDAGRTYVIALEGEDLRTRGAR